MIDFSSDEFRIAILRPDQESDVWDAYRYLAEESVLVETFSGAASLWIEGAGSSAPMTSAERDAFELRLLQDLELCETVARVAAVMEGLRAAAGRPAVRHVGGGPVPSGAAGRRSANDLFRRAVCALGLLLAATAGAVRWVGVQSDTSREAGAGLRASVGHSDVENSAANELSSLVALWREQSDDWHRQAEHASAARPNSSPRTPSESGVGLHSTNDREAEVGASLDDLSNEETAGEESEFASMEAEGRGPAQHSQRESVGESRYAVPAWLLAALQTQNAASSSDTPDEPRREEF